MVNIKFPIIIIFIFYSVKLWSIDPKEYERITSDAAMKEKMDVIRKLVNEKKANEKKDLSSKKLKNVDWSKLNKNENHKKVKQVDESDQKNANLNSTEVATEQATTQDEATLEQTENSGKSSIKGTKKTSKTNEDKKGEDITRWRTVGPMNENIRVEDKAEDEEIKKPLTPEEIKEQEYLKEKEDYLKQFKKSQ